jgi:hypothetical protein
MWLMIGFFLLRLTMCMDEAESFKEDYSFLLIQILTLININDVSPDLPWGLTVLNPITENGPLMGSQATVNDCSMLGIAVYYIRDILPNILYPTIYVYSVKSS